MKSIVDVYIQYAARKADLASMEGCYAFMAFVGTETSAEVKEDISGIPKKINLVSEQHTIGSSQGDDDSYIKIPHRLVSRTHAKIDATIHDKENDFFVTITDFSLHGTWVNGIKLEKGKPHVLKVRASKAGKGEE